MKKRNELFINKFESWLIDKGLVKKTIKKASKQYRFIS